MANAKHVAVLTQGIDIWNTWRADNSNIGTDLSEANLTGANLQGSEPDEGEPERNCAWECQSG